MDYNHVVDRIGEVIAGVAVLVAGAVIAVVAAAVRLGHHQAGVYRRFRQEFGRTILLGLELLVAGDIVRTGRRPAHPHQRGHPGHHRVDPHLPELLAGSGADRPLAMAEEHRPAPAGVTRRPRRQGAAYAPAGRVRGRQLTAASGRMISLAPPR